MAENDSLRKTLEHYLQLKSSKIEAGATNEYKVTGALTMHGVTRDVTLDVQEPGRGKDPWGNEYQYVFPGTHGHDYDLFSLGADGQPGGEGINADIGNWNEEQ